MMSRSPFAHIFILIAFLLNNFSFFSIAQAQEYRLPAPGVMVHLSPSFNPPILKGLKVHPDHPFRFEFIMDVGDDLKSFPKGRVMNPPLREESTRLIKYFLASLTIPDKDLWVNLSPYEKDRIIPQRFGLTEMGRDLLAEDYMLKQITASFIYPEDEVGKKFWKRIYEEAQKRFGTTNVSVNTFNKVWIIPAKAVVFENVKAGTAYVVESKLKVMLEQDYLSLEKHEGIQSLPSPVKGTNQLGSQIVREIIIPQLNIEVNENKNFAHLRQVYNSLILATWYKKKIKDSILQQVYTNKNKVAGINIDDPKEKEKIYQRYLQAFKKGVYNFIKEDVDSATQESIPRKYFSGGFGFERLVNTEQIVESIAVSVTNEEQNRGREVVVTEDMTLANKIGSAAMNASNTGGGSETLSMGTKKTLTIGIEPDKFENWREAIQLDDWKEVIQQEHRWHEGVDFKRLLGTSRALILGDTMHNLLAIQRGIVEHLIELKKAGFTHLLLEIPSDLSVSDIEAISQKTWIPHRNQQLVELAQEYGLKVVFIDMPVALQESPSTSDVERGVHMGNVIAKFLHDNPHAIVAVIAGYGHIRKYNEIPAQLEKNGFPFKIVPVVGEGQLDFNFGSVQLPVVQAIRELFGQDKYGYVDVEGLPFETRGAVAIVHFPRPKPIAPTITEFSYALDGFMRRASYGYYQMDRGEDEDAWKVSNQDKIIDFVSTLEGINSGQRDYLSQLLISYLENVKYRVFEGSIVYIGFVPKDQVFEITARNPSRDASNPKHVEVSLSTLEDRFAKNSTPSVGNRAMISSLKNFARTVPLIVAGLFATAQPSIAQVLNHPSAIVQAENQQVEGIKQDIRKLLVKAEDNREQIEDNMVSVFNLDVAQGLDMYEQVFEGNSPKLTMGILDKVFDKITAIVLEKGILQDPNLTIHQKELLLKIMSWYRGANRDPKFQNVLRGFVTNLFRTNSLEGIALVRKLNAADHRAYIYLRILISNFFQANKNRLEDIENPIIELTGRFLELNPQQQEDLLFFFQQEGIRDHMMIALAHVFEDVRTPDALKQRIFDVLPINYILDDMSREALIEFFTQKKWKDAKQQQTVLEYLRKKYSQQFSDSFKEIELRSPQTRVNLDAKGIGESTSSEGLVRALENDMDLIFAAYDSNASTIPQPLVDEYQNIWSHVAQRIEQGGATRENALSSLLRIQLEEMKSNSRRKSKVIFLALRKMPMMEENPGLLLSFFENNVSKEAYQFLKEVFGSGIFDKQYPSDQLVLASGKLSVLARHYVEGLLERNFNKEILEHNDYTVLLNWIIDNIASRLVVYSNTHYPASKLRADFLHDIMVSNVTVNEANANSNGEINPLFLLRLEEYPYYFAVRFHEDGHDYLHSLFWATPSWGDIFHEMFSDIVSVKTQLLFMPNANPVELYKLMLSRLNEVGGKPQDAYQGYLHTQSKGIHLLARKFIAQLIDEGLLNKRKDWDLLLGILENEAKSKTLSTRFSQSQWDGFTRSVRASFKAQRNAPVSKAMLSDIVNWLYNLRNSNLDKVGLTTSLPSTSGERRPDVENRNLKIPQAKFNFIDFKKPLGEAIRNLQNDQGIKTVQQAEDEELEGYQKIKGAVYQLSLRQYKNVLRRIGQRASLKGPIVFYPFGGFDAHKPFMLVEDAHDVVIQNASPWGSPKDIIKLMKQGYIRKGLSYGRFDSEMDFHHIAKDHHVNGLGGIALARIMSYLGGQIKGLYYFKLDTNGQPDYLLPSQMDLAGQGEYQHAVIEFDLKNGKGETRRVRYWNIYNHLEKDGSPYEKFISTLRFQSLLLLGVPQSLWRKYPSAILNRVLMPAKANNARVLTDDNTGGGEVSVDQANPIWKSFYRFLKLRSLKLPRGESLGYSIGGNKIYYGNSNGFLDKLKVGPNQAMNSGKSLRGGIDFTKVAIQNSGGAIKFHVDAAMLKQLQNAPGFVPVIISIQPMVNLRKFLGVGG